MKLCVRPAAPAGQSCPAPRDAAPPSAIRPRLALDRCHFGTLRTCGSIGTLYHGLPRLLERCPAAIRMPSFPLKPVRPTDRCLSLAGLYLKSCLRSRRRAPTGCAVYPCEPPPGRYLHPSTKPAAQPSPSASPCRRGYRAPSFAQPHRAKGGVRPLWHSSNPQSLPGAHQPAASSQVRVPHVPRTWGHGFSVHRHSVPAPTTPAALCQLPHHRICGIAPARPFAAPLQNPQKMRSQHWRTFPPNQLDLNKGELHRIYPSKRRRKPPRR